MGSFRFLFLDLSGDPSDSNPISLGKSTISLKDFCKNEQPQHRTLIGFNWILEMAL